MKKIASDRVGWYILKLLGIETDYIREATIKIKVDEIVTAEVLFLATDETGKILLTEDGEDIETVLKQYELKEIK